MYVFSNICNNGEKEHLKILVDHNIIPIYIEFLEEFKETKVLLNILEGLYLLLKRGDHMSQNGENPFLKIFEENLGPKKLEELQSHPSKYVFKKANEMLEHFFEYQMEV